MFSGRGNTTVLLFAGIIALLPAVESRAWNETGHRLSALIAWEQLDADGRAAAISLLHRHPRFAKDFRAQVPARVAAGGPQRVNRWLLGQAAVWPDLARGYQGSLRSRYHRPQWHYINEPLFLSTAQRDALQDKLKVNLGRDAPAAPRANLNAIQAFKLNLVLLQDAAAAPAQRAIALCWVLHIGADVHQPLHTTALFTVNRWPRGDRGGNAIPVSNMGWANNLHKVWDRFAGRASSPRVIDRIATRLVQAHGSAAQSAAAQLDVDAWVDEAYELTARWVYDGAILAAVWQAETSGQEMAAVALGAPYKQHGKEVAGAQVTTAGYRLARVLKGAL